MAAECTHLDQIRLTNTDKHVCEECIKTGDTWVHLRMCLECGHVGCCDSSKNKHATKHFRHSKHPLVRSIERAKIGCGAMSMELRRENCVLTALSLFTGESIVYGNT